MADALELDPAVVPGAFGEAYFNLIRRGADGSLRLSADHWRLAGTTAATYRFAAREPEAAPLEVPRADVSRVVWDRLPRQQARSQLRFFMANGDVWTFSGHVDESVLPPR